LTFPLSHGIILMRKPETFSNWGTSFFAFLLKKYAILTMLLMCIVNDIENLPFLC